MAKIRTSAFVADWFRLNGRGLIGSAALILLIGVPLIYLNARKTSAVLERAQIAGQIVSAGIDAADPRTAAGRGLRYEYLVRLNDGRMITVRGPIDRPHAVGEEISITRSIHENGRNSFRLTDAPAY